MNIELTEDQINALLSAVRVAKSECEETEDMLSAANILLESISKPNDWFIICFNQWLADTSAGWQYNGSNPFKAAMEGNTRLESYLNQYAEHLGYGDMVDMMEGEWAEE